VDELLLRELRANPEYELVLFDRLPAGERRALADLSREPGFYGVLRPQGGSELVLRSVDRDTALLFLTLREPGSLPAYARASLGEAAPRTVARLVADGVLEVAGDRGFVSGPAAMELLRGGSGASGDGRLASLSLAALRAAQALPLEDAERLTWFLYAFNRRPLTPAWKRLLPNGAAVERYLGIAAGGANRARLNRSWSRVETQGWLSWKARGRPASEPSRPAATYKLFVSPLPEALADSFGAILEALTAARARQFKVGANANGLLRPDKIVAYFTGFEPLAEAAAEVRQRLGGAPAHGVPFTSGIGGDGLLSWGVDPPQTEWGSFVGDSWRLWLARRLAQAILAARRSPASGVEPWSFALERLRLDGIDTITWTPGALLWKES
jgi:hypothetical protein